jgi:arylsulfatase A-like enzyme
MKTKTMAILESSSAMLLLAVTSGVRANEYISARSEGKQQNKGKPNVIIVMTDDQGYGELSCHGNPILKTLQLDKLHDRSIRFTNYHASPMSTPTRGQLITGLDASRNCATNVACGRVLPRPELETLGSIFADNGYSTGIFGKWHLGDNYPFRPDDRGFQETIWFPSANIGSTVDLWGNKCFNPSFIHNSKREQYQGYCTDILFDQAKQWMKKVSGESKPFLVYLPTNAPHVPLAAKDEDIKEIEAAIANSEFSGLEPTLKSSLTLYLAMIRNIDTNMGKLVLFLNEEHLAENTILIFATDNGSTYGYQYFNAGMRGHKVELYEGGHRVPLFISWPGGGFTTPRDVKELAEVQDILPTLIDLCKLNTRTGTKFDGISLAKVLRGNEKISDDRMIVINYSRSSGNLEYPSNDAPSIIRREGAAVLWKQWRLLADRELYDLSSDPMQVNNVIQKYPEVIQKMRAHLDNWWNEVKGIANVPQRVVIGSDKQNPMMLSSCDWIDVYLDTESLMGTGMHKNSYWNLLVDQPGEYEFELRRWLRETNTGLADKVTGGTAFPISSARILIKSDVKENKAQPLIIKEEKKDVQTGDKSVIFNAHLDPGPITLQTWFYDAKNNPLCGAFYVYVRRM